MTGFDTEYDDSQRLDETETAEDYNRFEEEQVFLDHEAEDWDDKTGYYDEGE